MTTQTGRAFNEWLRAQLKAKKMSQRQLAQQSGVDHSTISRLIRGDRMPSLGTATALARGLREIRDDADTAGYLGLVTSSSQNPTARVEYGLRSDEALGEGQVRQIMEYYLAVRMRRFGRVFQPGGAASNGNGTNGHAFDGDHTGDDEDDDDATSSSAPDCVRGSAGPQRTQSAGPQRTQSAGPQRAQKAGPQRIEPLPVGSRPLGYAHLPPRSGGLGPVGRVQTRVSGASTLTRKPGRTLDRY
ncbi:MAG: helix-turn-helix transcriptional regulator [Chloroflexi bacterium]|nr:helix-turn-helix transcriptional regulator [Chloroflexota bacterium]